MGSRRKHDTCDLGLLEFDVIVLHDDNSWSWIPARVDFECNLVSVSGASSGSRPIFSVYLWGFRIELDAFAIVLIGDTLNLSGDIVTDLIREYA